MIPFVVVFSCIIAATHISRKKLGRSYVKQLSAGIIAGLIAMLAVAWIYAKIYHYPFVIFN
jgi:hypothetical protein